MQVFPLAVNVMDKIDESRRAICQAKGHHVVGPFDGIRALECELFLTSDVLSEERSKD